MEDFEHIKSRFIFWLINLRRYQKRFLLILVDLILMYFALWGALCLRLSTFYIPETVTLALIFGCAPFIGVAVFHYMNIYRQVTRYIDQKYAVRIYGRDDT